MLIIIISSPIIDPDHRGFRLTNRGKKKIPKIMRDIIQETTMLRYSILQFAVLSTNEVKTTE